MSSFLMVIQKSAKEGHIRQWTAAETHRPSEMTHDEAGVGLGEAAAMPHFLSTETETGSQRLGWLFLNNYDVEFHFQLK